MINKLILTFCACIVCIVCYVAYYLLLIDSFHISIGAIFNHARFCTGKEHLLILALMPVYIAVMIFGAALLGSYLGKKISQFFITPPEK